MFNYGSFKLFVIKLFSGIVLILFSIILILSLITYSDADPGIGKFNSKAEIINFFGFAGAIISSFFFLILGASSFILAFFIFYLGSVLALGVKIKFLLIKFLLILLSIPSINISILLLDIKIFHTGLLSDLILDLLIYYFPAVITTTFYRITLSFFLVIISIYFLINSFSLKINLLKNIYSKFFKSFFIFLFKPFNFIYYFMRQRTRPGVKNTKIKNEPTINKNKRVFYSSSNEINKNDQIKKDENEFVFDLPSADYLVKSKTKNSYKKEVENLNKINSEKLEKVLSEYGVDGKITGFKTGPIVTLYEFIPNAGIKASKVIGLSDDIARAMSSVSARISSQPGKTSLGIEIPNSKRENVMFGDLVDNSRFEESEKSLTLALGKNISGQEVYADLEKMPHLLIAGTTGSGKSVGINTIIMSLLYRFKPDECKLILIDPKMLELSIYEDIPHLLTPVVTNPNKAVFALKWVVKEMENRYKLMSSLNVKNINSYNEKSRRVFSSGKKLYRKVQTGIDNETRQPIFEKREIPLEKMPFIVVVIDEMADLMMVAGKEVENLVQRLAQMARASGIHLVTATQRPSVDVITGTIKANFPSRISYKVASKFDSRTILNEMGAEQLLGSGDMLYLDNGANLKRLHGGFISENEIEKVVNFIKGQATFDQNNEIKIDESSAESSMAFKFDDGEVDSLYSKAVNLVVDQQRVSTSYIQRYLQIGYNRAARIVEKMEEDGIISEANNAGKRQVLRKN